MNQHTSAIRPAVCGVALLALLGLFTTAAADSDDLITTASTAGTTAYTVGKKIDDNGFVQARAFADARAVALRRESALGEGENLAALAALLGAPDAGAFGRWMQSHYAALYADDAVRARPNLAARIVAMR